MLKMTNKARALAVLNSQASLIVPLAVPQTGFPSSIRLDPSSAWHVGALFAVALESTTLYTRLRDTGSVNSTSFGTITDLLNVYGKQTIARMSMAVPESQTQQKKGDEQATATINGRGYDIGENRGNADYDDTSAAGSQQEPIVLDIDLSSPEELNLETGRRQGRRKDHLFSQIATYRAEPDEDDTPSTLGSQQQGQYVRRHRQKFHQYVHIWPSCICRSRRLTLVTDCDRTLCSRFWTAFQLFFAARMAGLSRIIQHSRPP